MFFLIKFLKSCKVLLYYIKLYKNILFYSGFPAAFVESVSNFPT